MTDNEIIKALECHKFAYDPYMQFVVEQTLDLINRQNAEIERLCVELDEVIIVKDLLFDEAKALIKKAKAEAVKEFAEKMKGVIPEIDDTYIERIVEDYIDNLVKEMVGDSDEN